MAPLFNICLHTLWQWWLPPNVSCSHGIFSHSFFANCSSSWMFAGFFYPVADFSSYQKCSVGVRSGLIAGHLKAVHFYSFSTILACFWMRALGLCLAGGPMIFDSNHILLHWAGHFTLKSLDNSLISWFLWYSQGLQYQMQQSSTTALWIFHHA